MIAHRFRMNNISKSSIIRLISYLTDSQGNEQRVGEVRITNCEADDPQWAALEMTAIQRLNTRAQGDKTYHLVLSFQEHPTPQVIHAIEDAVCSKLGFDGHQRVSVLHGDTDNLHLHISINKIHPERLTMHEPYYDYKTLADLCVQLERQYGLAVDNHVPRSEAVETAAKSMEQAGDLESLIGWIQRTCLDELKQAGSWDELQEILATSGLAMKERGNGLVFVSGDLHVKASSVDRSLSKKRLEERFGAFKPLTATSHDVSRAYCKKPMQHGEFNSTELWQRFQECRKQQDEERKTILQTARQQREADYATAKEVADTQTLVIRSMVQGNIMKRVLYALNRARLQRKRKEIQDHYQTLVSTCKTRPRQSWRVWLHDEALNGNMEALMAMRARDERQKCTTDTVRAEAVKITRKGTILYPDGSRATGTQHASEPEHEQEYHASKTRRI